jgi:hypothetical protein
MESRSPNHEIRISKFIHHEGAKGVKERESEFGAASFFVFFRLFSATPNYFSVQSPHAKKPRSHGIRLPRRRGAAEQRNKEGRDRGNPLLRLLRIFAAKFFHHEGTEDAKERE